jgi:bifunctional non-homologous end joining protein LigD
VLRDGVLKSWAIPKAQMPKKNEKFLAIRTPDHLKMWYDFEGTIEDLYGRGEVKIYDRGKCNILMWRPDRIGIELHGEIVKGIFWLVRLAGQDKNWLILRSK